MNEWMNDDDDDDVFAISLVDWYAVRLQSLKNICLATFAVNYKVQSIVTSTNATDSDNEIEPSEDLNTGEHKHSEINIQKITLQNGLVPWEKEAKIQYWELQGTKYTITQKNTITQNFCCITHGLMKRKILNGFNSYQDSYIAKQHIIHPNAHHFNDDCKLLDLSPECRKWNTSICLRLKCTMHSTRW